MGKLLLYRYGEGRFYDVDSVGGMRLLKTHTGWRTNWTHIIPGNFGGPGTLGPNPGDNGGSFRYASLLFYDGAGTGEFHAIDENNEVPLIKTHTGWVGDNVPWTHIIPGKYSDKEKFGYTGLLFYDSAGTGAFYQTYGQGELTELKVHTGWVGGNVPWTHIKELTSVWTGTSYSERLLFYNSAGTGAIYKTSGQGEIAELKTYTGWQSAGKPWTHIIPLLALTFGGTPNSLKSYSHLLFYDSVGGELADYTYNAEFEMVPFKTYPGFGAGWQQIIPILMPGATIAGPNSLLNLLLFYEGAGGRAEFYRYDERQEYLIPYSQYNFPANCRIITVFPF